NIGWGDRTRTCEMQESKSCALPTWLRPINLAHLRGFEPRAHGLEVRCSIQLSYRCILERVKGIEPSQPAWKAGALPLSYTRVDRAIDKLLISCDLFIIT